MADIELVIKIPEELYEYIKKHGLCGYCSDREIVSEAIANGKPLKGHGRLIDADAYIDKHEECGWLDDITVDEFNAITPTIIEVDKEQEE